MAKHEKVQCPKCGQEEAKSALSLLFGCRKCKAAVPPAERTRIVAEYNLHRGTEAARNADDAKVARKHGFDTPEAVRAIDERITRHIATEAAVEAALDRTVINPLCACCLDYRTPDLEAQGWVEMYDGKWFCARCAYGVERTGHCTLHKTTHYETDVPRLRIDDYPDAVLAPFTKKMFT